MSQRAIGSPFLTAALQCFTIRDGRLLYANFPRDSVQDLQKILSRGSGQAVRGGTRSKLWFEAQCAHYRLPMKAKLAMLRLHLTNYLKSIQDRMDREEKGHCVAERKLCALVIAGRTTESAAPRTPQSKSTPLPGGAVSIMVPQTPPKISLPSPPATVVPSRTQVLPPTLSKIAEPVAPSLAFLSSTPITPVSCNKSRRQTARSLTPEKPSNRTKCLGEHRKSNPFLVSELQTAYLSPNAPYNLVPPNQSGPMNSRLLDSPLQMNCVSGRWSLRVTRSTIHTSITPIRSVLRPEQALGEMDVHLSRSGNSLTAEFDLLGLSGMIKSNEFEPVEGGVSALVKFVAQMEGATGYQDTVVLGPSRGRRGYIRFESTKLEGKLKCHQYGELEFEGHWVGTPRKLCAKWSDWS